MNAHILVLDDEINYLLVLETILEEEGYQVTTLQDPQMAMEYLEESEIDVIITDMRMPKMNGQEILLKIQREYPHIPVLIMTAFGSIDLAVEAIKAGAFDYITKPFDNNELLLSVSKAVQLARAEQQNRILRQTLAQQYGQHRILGQSRAILQLLQLIEKVGGSKSTVLVTGESGTGKELVARAIHAVSPRSQKAFISVNCASLSPGVLESELFGHEKGSFTGAVARKRGRFELAHGGTLFLDEIGEMALDTQVKLLRVLQEKTVERVGGTESIEVDFRLVAATNRNLQHDVEEGRFREDLFYRLNVVNLSLPPLRERRDDIPLLAAHFLEQYAKENKRDVQGFSVECMDRLCTAEWPGNVRQLQNVIERAVVLATKSVITLDDLPVELREENLQMQSVVDLLPHRLNMAETLEKIEVALVRRALVRSEFVQVKAADLLGISKSLLQYKLKKYGLMSK